MNGREMGFLLLTSHLGDPQRKVLTAAQLRLLSQCVRASDIPDGEGEITERDLMALGYNRPSAQRILGLLSETERLCCYLQMGTRQDCIPITRVSEGYPAALRMRLGLDSPGCLWAKGDLSLLDTPKIALVGSRELYAPNQAFAKEVGRQAALQGMTLVSGNARGADRVAQEACLANGGRVISVIADTLTEHPKQKGVLYLSEDGYDLAFSAQRALSRNRVIHSLGYLTFVAQCTLETGGTWDGTRKNLRYGWSPVFCFDDGSPAAEALAQMGAMLLTSSALADISALQLNRNLFDQ